MKFIRLILAALIAAAMCAVFFSCKAPDDDPGTSPANPHAGSSDVISRISGYSDASPDISDDDASEDDASDGDASEDDASKDDVSKDDFSEDDVSGGFIQDYPTCTCYLPKLEPSDSDELVPPGTLPDADRMPEADDTLVGSTISREFAPECPLASMSFMYYYDSGSGLERLVTVETHSSAQVALLKVYETAFGGGAGLYDAYYGNSLEGELLEAVFVSFQEGMYADLSSVTTSDENTDGGVFYGRVYSCRIDRLDALSGGRYGVLVKDGPESVRKQYKVFERIYDRFEERFSLKSTVFPE